MRVRIQCNHLHLLLAIMMVRKALRLVMQMQENLQVTLKLTMTFPFKVNYYG
jgi:hypothetical protein